MKIKYVHTNLVAKDWKELAQFYIDVFGCRIKPPERNLKGEWLDQVTSLHDAHITGAHLILPGYDDEGPTLEIFQYDELEGDNHRVPNAPGYGHIAFSTDDVEGCIDRIRRNGGSLVGEIVRTNIQGIGFIHFAYAHDPEGNIIEIQKWE